MSAQHTLFNTETFNTNEEFKQARACWMATNRDEAPTKQAQKAYDDVLGRLQAKKKVSEDKAEEMLESIIRDETLKRQTEGNTTLVQQGEAVNQQIKDCMPRTQQFN